MTTDKIPCGPTPVRAVCPSCHSSIDTKAVHVNSIKTHVIALIMCIFLLWPCCLIPYCMDSCRNVNHICPNCNAFIGEYRR